jgi:hypothetical protein
MLKANYWAKQRGPKVSEDTTEEEESGHKNWPHFNFVNQFLQTKEGGAFSFQIFATSACLLTACHVRSQGRCDRYMPAAYCAKCLDRRNKILPFFASGKRL